MPINKKITVIFIVFLAVIFLLPHTALAQTEYGVNDLVDAGVNLTSGDIRTTIAAIINVFLGFLGVIAVVIILYGGFIWMTSQGNPEKIDKAKKLIVSAAIGIAIILASWAIAAFIIQEIGLGGSGGDGDDGGGGGYIGGTGLGGSVLESHYPARNATDIARNTNIYVTFKEPMNTDTIVAIPGCTTDCESNTNIRLINLKTTIPLATTDLRVTYTDSKVFQFDPVNFLGEDNEHVSYKMVLNSLETGNGEQAFPLSGFYDWNFTVSNIIDLTPPTVVAVIPADATADNPRNSSVQITFSEAVSPTTVTGKTTDGFNFITLTGNNVGLLNGEYKISNQYRTVSFVTDDLCGQNSCGGNVYCLPGLENITGVVTTNVKDMNDNNLANEYSWTFGTNNDIDLTPPTIVSRSTGANFPMIAPIEIIFDSDLLSSSVNTGSAGLYESTPGDVNVWITMPDSRTIHINHDKLKSLTDYIPILNAGIKDSNQNCWYPCN